MQCHVCIFQRLTTEKFNACCTVWRKKKKKKDRRDTDRWTEEGNACQMSMGKWTMRESDRMKLADALGPRSLHGHDMPVITGWNVVVWLMDSSRGSGVESVKSPRGKKQREEAEEKNFSIISSQKTKTPQVWWLRTKSPSDGFLAAMCRSDTPD